jgi:hypothetical protein
MAKKATSKPKEDKTTLPKVIQVAKVVTPEPPVVEETSEDDDDPFADTSKEVKFPARVEIEQETEEDKTEEASDDPFSEDENTEEDDEVDSEDLISSTEKTEEEDKFVGIVEIGKNVKVSNQKTEYPDNERIYDLESQVTSLKLELEELRSASSKEDSVSDLFDRLYKRIKDERVEMVLAMVQDGYLKLKYKSHTDTEKEKLELKLKKFLAQQMEGTIKAAKIIHESEVSV